MYKKKPRVVMHRYYGKIHQKVTPYDVLSPSRVRDLVAWLSRYLNKVAPTEKSVAVAGLRASLRGAERNLLNIEAKPLWGQEK